MNEHSISIIFMRCNKIELEERPVAVLIGVPQCITSLSGCLYY